MADIATVSQLLEKSLAPSTAKIAEESLRAVEGQQGFPSTLLHVVATSDLSIPVRLAGSLYFKNLIKRKWIDENGVYRLHTDDVQIVKTQIVALMIQLPDSLQVQIGEAVSLIAESEFPELWPDLIDELVGKLSPDNMHTNKGVLKVAHSIFKRWRPLFGSNELYSEINLVLSKFAQPFLEILKMVDHLIEENVNNKDNLALLFENLLLLVKIYYDLNCQDIPEFFEDHLQEGMAVIHKYLKYSNPLLQDSDEDDEIDILTLVKTSCCELIQLYTTRYQEELGSLITEFIKTIWDLLSSIGPQPKYDILASKSLQFMTIIASLEAYNSALKSEGALKEISEKIILPNVLLRESDEELFEDDPIEYTRRDLEGSDSDTRRRAATDFLRALKENEEQEVTKVVMTYVNHYLSDFQSDSSHWKSKDLAICLFSSIAAKGSITNAGITSTNLLVDVVNFFSEFVAQDLVNQVSHPILKVDAIKYIFTFRNQLTKQQLIEAFPLLSSHFQDSNYVVYTYAAITIEKILSLRNPASHQQLLFGKSDIPSAVFEDLLMNLFRLMFSKGDSPEKLAENEFLMKCAMRILLTAEDSLGTVAPQLLQQLMKIVDIIGKNPSNPKFSHYTFESICVIIKFNNSQITSIFELIKPCLLSVLSQDIQEFIPYSFQILAYCLENFPHTEKIPVEYEQLIKPLCSPAVWEFRANVPAIERLLSAIIKAQPTVFTSTSSLTPILGVFQKLISSKLNDHLGFDFLEAILLNIDISYLNPFMKEIAMILLSRLQTSRTEKFVKRFIVFLSSIAALPTSNDPAFKKNPLNSSFVIQFIENVQVGIFQQILTSVITPTIESFNNLLDKKILIVGLVNLITEQSQVLGLENFKLVLSKLLRISSSDSIKNYKNFNENVELLLELENDELSFGSSFNQLNIIQQRPFDPVKEISSKEMISTYLRTKLTSFPNIQAVLVTLDQPDQELVRSLGIS
ncbi:hypothetical protein OGAPHI_007078 [Ogataea philodendri]|uniref:Importin N-terminal domain-containing protein n=1 Tax=Ogataea philodendri TaxID=1378263 RepID=A0A9P8NWI1_9ASCO|nr:uncharacterized protein OGAPHI_007078 [Ogataea philodendri]KAH3660492.1 hypothetical protein OGAPHI_007078 [Ogataea philodendri]